MSKRKKEEEREIIQCPNENKEEEGEIIQCPNKKRGRGRDNTMSK